MSDEEHDLMVAKKHYYRVLYKTTKADLPKELHKAEERFQAAVIARRYNQLNCYARVLALRQLCDERGVEYETTL